MARVCVIVRPALSSWSKYLNEVWMIDQASDETKITTKPCKLQQMFPNPSPRAAKVLGHGYEEAVSCLVISKLLTGCARWATLESL